MMGVVHHAVYPVWFEVGRTDLMLALGLPYTQIEARGYYLMLSGLSVEYRRAAKYGDSVTILTRAAQVRSRTITFSYAVYRAEELLATGETRHIATDHAYRPARLPDDVQAALSVGTR
nr:thioesterase family protein [Deinococcus sp. KSM4-11]